MLFIQVFLGALYLMYIFGKIDKNGFTLVELLVATSIFLVVITAMSSTFISQQKTYAVQGNISEMTQGARAAMNMLSTEVSQAGYNPMEITIAGIPYSATQLQLFADLNGDEDTSDISENIIYTYDSQNLRINRNDVNLDNTPTPFAENIESYSVKYLKEDGITEVTSVGETAEIKSIEITINTRTSDPDPEYSENSGYRTFTLTSHITPLSLGL
jgi:type IV pilus assembly protein PilW